MNPINKPTELTWNKLQKFMDDGSYFAEPKFDGIRCTLSKDGLFHDETNKAFQFPELMKDAEKLPEGTILDGELCLPTSDYTADFFTILQRNCRDPLKIKLLAKKFPATFMVFDILKFKGEDVTRQELFNRKKLITETVYGQSQVFWNVKPVYERAINVILPFIKKYNMEGIVIKQESGKYSSEWYKFKNYVEHDFKVIGLHLNSSKWSLELQNEKGDWVGNVTFTGYPQTDEWKGKVIGMTAKVRHMWTNKGNVRFPVLKELV